MGVSERTLQRRLGEEETNYATVLSEVRQSTAEKYLRKPDVSLSEVAWLLGFAEQSSFTRAFKRWTGQSPGAFRAGTSSRQQL
jgi:AraC-like DNA-binding protein